MKTIIEVLFVVGMLVGMYGFILAVAADKKQPKPGRDFDERGPYDTWSEQDKKNSAKDNWAK